MMKQLQPVNLGNNIQHHWPQGNAKKSHNETPFHPGQKSRVRARAGGDVDKREVSTGM